MLNAKPNLSCYHLFFYRLYIVCSGVDLDPPDNILFVNKTLFLMLTRPETRYEEADTPIWEYEVGGHTDPGMKKLIV